MAFTYYLVVTSSYRGPGFYGSKQELPTQCYKFSEQGDEEQTYSCSSVEIASEKKLQKWLNSNKAVFTSPKAYHWFETQDKSRITFRHDGSPFTEKFSASKNTYTIKSVEPTAASTIENVVGKRNDKKSCVIL